MFPTLIFSFAYFGMLSAQTIRFERNLLPLLPAVFALAAVGAGDAVRLVQRQTHRWPSSSYAFATLVAAILVTEPAMRTFELLGKYRRDPRGDARQWLDRQLPENARIAVDAYTPYLQPKNREIRGNFFLADEKQNSWNELDFAIVTAAGSGRFKNSKGSRQAANLAKIEEAACAVQYFPAPPKRPLVTLFQLKCP